MLEPDLPCLHRKCGIFRKIRRGRTRRAVRTVEGELKLETPSHPPRDAATLHFIFASEGCDELQRAGQQFTLRRRRIGFEPALMGGAKDANDRNLLNHTLWQIAPIRNR